MIYKDNKYKDCEQQHSIHCFLITSAQRLHIELFNFLSIFQHLSHLSPSAFKTFTPISSIFCSLYAVFGTWFLLSKEDETMHN